MLKIKYFLPILSIIFLLTFYINEDKLIPTPMPFYQGLIKLGIETQNPEPHRDDSVKRWMIPSVRIRVPGAAGSGTICYYDQNDNTAYVISCAHLFKRGDTKAQVEVFFKNNQKLPTPQKFEAKVISFKTDYYADDISFMTFKPDWNLSSWFPIASINYPITKDEKYFSCGCDAAGEVACYFVKPQGIDGAFLATKENSPRPGRSGGGLMDADGWFVGICVRTSRADGNGIGYFVHLKTIHEYCHVNRLEYLLKVQRPNDLLQKILIIDRNGPQGTYPENYIPFP